MADSDPPAISVPPQKGVDWHKWLAISNWLLALATVALLGGAWLGYRTSIRAVHNDATYEYLEVWNSDYMLRQRQILAKALQGSFNDSDFNNKISSRTPLTDSDCEYKPTLRQDDLKPLYGGVYGGPNLVSDKFNPSQRAAFASIRAFFEELGSAYYGKDVEQHELFQTFSLPAEAYWTLAVSPWLSAEFSKTPADQTLGTEFRFLECNIELEEQHHAEQDQGEQNRAQQRTSTITSDGIRLVIDQDADLSIDAPVTVDSMEFGPRIPTEYFVTKGKGESDEGIPPDPYETFSYDIALRQAGIEDFNVVPYTSVLPPEAQEAPLQELKPTFHHGAVLETIMAKAGGVKNQTVCAGVGRVWALNAVGAKVGGYAAEYEYASDKIIAETVGERAARAQLTRSLNHELSIRGFKQTGEMKFDVACLPIHKKYGMAIAALGFVKFIFPETTTAKPQH